jgi:hypothetical protein
VLKRSWPEEEWSPVLTLLGALRPLFGLERTLPTRCVEAFLLVARHEGLSVGSVKVSAVIALGFSPPGRL